MFKKSRRGNGRAGLSLQPDGIGMAHVERRVGHTPRLAGCVYSPYTAGHEPAEQAKRLAAEAGVGNVALSGVMDLDDYQLLLVEAPDVPSAEMVDAVKWRIRDLVPYEPEDTVVDVFELPEQSRQGQVRMMYAVAAAGEAVRSQIDTITGSGLELDVLDIPELCIRNIAAELGSDADGVATLYLTERHGLITLTRDGVLYLSRRIEFAGGLEPPGEHVSFPGPAEIEQIALEAQRSLDYYESHYDARPVSELVVCPCRFPVTDFLAGLSAQLSVRVSSLDLNELLDCETEVPVDVQASCIPAVGAALRREQVAL